MALLRPKHERNPRGRTLPEYVTIQCAAFGRGHRVSWCRLMCEPIGNKGACGRLAPHAMVSKTQVAIAAYNEAIGME